MKKRLCTIGCILAASVMMFGGCASGNSKAESKENASSQSEAAEVTESKATESKEGKRSSDFTTDYTYPGTKSGFVILDFFMNEEGETKQDVSLAHLGAIKDITADDVLELAVSPLSSLCFIVGLAIQLILASLLTALCDGSTRMTSKNLYVASCPTQYELRTLKFPNFLPTLSSATLLSDLANLRPTTP